MIYILIVICRFSRWIEQTSVPDNRSVVKFLKAQVFQGFCLPDIISWDNGPHFVAEIIETTVKLLGVLCVILGQKEHLNELKAC